MKEKNTRELVQFIGITFLISWALWLLPFLKNNGMPNLPEIVGLPGMFAPLGPAIAAFWLTWHNLGKEETKKFWFRGWQLKFKKKWLLPVLLIGPISAIFAVALIYKVEGSIAWEYGVPVSMILPVFLIIYFTNALPEEYGWRGYALERLQNNWSALGASLILGLIWALWHLPLFFIEGTTQAEIPLYQFVLQTMVLSVIYTWLYNNTDGNIFIVSFFHAVSNISAAVMPFWINDFGRWVNFGILISITIGIVFRWGWKKLSLD